MEIIWTAALNRCSNNLPYVICHRGTWESELKIENIIHKLKWEKDCWIEIVFVCGVVIIIICRTSVCQFAFWQQGKMLCCVVWIIDCVDFCLNCLRLVPAGVAVLLNSLLEETFIYKTVVSSAREIDLRLVVWVYSHISQLGENFIGYNLSTCLFILLFCMVWLSFCDVLIRLEVGINSIWNYYFNSIGYNDSRNISFIIYCYILSCFSDET